MSPVRNSISNGMRPRVAAIVPSAGYGKRLGLKIKKPFVRLGAMPLAAHALKTLDSCGAIDAIIIAAEKTCIKRFKALVKKYKIKKITYVVVGGRTRFQSVKNCLAKIDDSFDIVLVHDAARPFVQRSTIKDSIRLAARYGACIVAIPESDTVKCVGKDLFIKKTLPRSGIYRAETPQAFKRSLLMKAYSIKHKGNVTDDASIVEALGKRVKVLKGAYRNIKITTKEDLKLAEVLL